MRRRRRGVALMDLGVGLGLAGPVLAAAIGLAVAAAGQGDSLAGHAEALARARRAEAGIRRDHAAATPASVSVRDGGTLLDLTRVGSAGPVEVTYRSAEGGLTREADGALRRFPGVSARFSVGATGPRPAWIRVDLRATAPGRDRPIEAHFLLFVPEADLEEVAPLAAADPAGATAVPP